ncbi:MAG: PSD1 and planctomycete cytochrome C domain-containing protein, partial [Verrucomicrobiota bacterium]|nr:PSD1 and planctomycete cytochrome C domain-containing protein [Verrucomicrobiota bacterium]
MDYAKEIKPVLQARCYSCHGALKQKGGLRLDTVEAMRKGGEDGPAIEPGQAEKSGLLQRVRSPDEEERMPREGEPLSAEQIARLTAWIEEGAPAPANEQPESDPRGHWAFTPPRRPEIPGSAPGNVGAINPIDALLESEHHRRGLVAQPAAPPATLLRRVYLDLIGLPPTREELHAFLADTAPDAFERVVDRLLAQPAYGERWGRHWMDIWRYSDWYGLGAQLRNSQKHIWHWRDWIIESLNADKGYDRMIREMLAGDELAPEDPGVLRATGFLARNYFLFNRNTWLESTVEHTGKAFLGLTLNCAKCHTHKFDPIGHEEYYRFRAFFEPHQVRLDPLPGEPDLEKNGLPRVFDAHAGAPTWLFVRGDERHPDKSRPLAPALPEFFDASLEIEPVKLTPAAFAPTTIDWVQRDQLRLAEKTCTDARAALVKAREALANAERREIEPKAATEPGKDKPRLPSLAEARAAAIAAGHTVASSQLRIQMLTASFVADRARFSDPPAANAPELARAAALSEKLYLLAKAQDDIAAARLELERAAGAKDKVAAAQKKVKAAEAALAKARQAAAAPGERYISVRVARKAFEGPTEKEENLPAVFPTSSTGRRLALANWIASSRNPLTARVAVNHIWMRHFGEPLVRNVEDFGRKTPAPELQPLLDWLAVELQEHGWSMKHLHRLIVTSAAYRMSSSTAGAAPANRAADPDNRYLWRRPTLRMEGEAVRDAVLHLAGELDLTMGGPPVPAKDEDSRRRTLYFTRSLQEQHRFLAIFDAPDVLECYRRLDSVVPQQALAMANSKLTLGMAPKIAERLARGLGPGATDEDFI